MDGKYIKTDELLVITKGLYLLSTQPLTLHQRNTVNRLVGELSRECAQRLAGKLEEVGDHVIGSALDLLNAEDLTPTERAGLEALAQEISGS